MKRKNNMIVARKGEHLVFSLLPEANWINGERELRKPYEIIWKGIKIDVKATENVIDNHFTFYDNSPDSETNVIFVFVAFWDNKQRFWVEKGNTNKRSHTRSLSRESISEENLPSEILKVHKEQNLK